MNAETTFKNEWLQKVIDNSETLRQLIRDYHPSMRRQSSWQPMPITAPAAEAACDIVRAKIAKEQTSDPLSRWDKAVADGDVGEIMSLLNGAWFGVPESTSCWSIPGFSIAVDLLDDPPDPPAE